MATYYFRNTGTNWGNPGDWSATPFSSGYTAGAVPTQTDDAVFEAASANCIVNTGATRNCRSLTCTAYVGTITFNITLNVVGGNITLGTASMTLTGTFGLTSNISGVAAISYSSSGCICAVPFTISRSPGGATTVTMASNWTQRGNFTITNSGAGTTFNGNTITFDRTCTILFTSIAGSTTFLISPIVGNTVTLTGSSPTMATPLTIGGAGTVNLNLSFAYSTNTFTYTPASSTVTHTGTLTMAGGTYNTAGIVFQNGSTSSSGATTSTLTSDITFSGNFTIPASIPTINGVGRRVLVGGNFTNSNSGGPVPGTATLTMNGSGTISGTATQPFNMPFEINTSGTITFSGTIQWLRNITHTSGTVLGSTSTVTCASAATFTINAMGFALNSLVTTTATFTGSQGLTISSYTCTVASSTITFQSGNTYTITSSLSLQGNPSPARIVFRSSTLGVQANVNLNPAATFSVGYVEATDINSAGGQTIWNYNGALSNTVNWNLLQRPVTVGYPWVQ